MSFLRLLLRSFIKALVIFTIYVVAEYNDHPKTPELQTYVKEFIADAKARGIELSDDNLTIDFKGHLSNTHDGLVTIGMCLPFLFSKREVFIDPNHWAFASPIERKVLIYHELGHCLLGLEHRDDGPHIMNSIIISDWYYSDALIDEEFRDYRTATHKLFPQDRPQRAE